jgi:hypothetical protein
MRTATLALLACASLAGLSVPVRAAAPATAPDLSARIAAAEARLREIGQRAARLEDYDALRNLQQMHGYYVDKALWEQVADLFAEDATLEVGQHGIHRGKAAIRRYLLGLTGGRSGLVHGQLNNHFTLSPVITIAPDGRTAQARWRLIVQDGQFGDPTGGNWGSGVYENRYVKEDGIWKIAHLGLAMRFYAPYDEGWSKATPQLTARYGRSTARPASPSPQRALWPARVDPGFHFDNPGTSGYRLAAPGSAPAPEKHASTVTDIDALARALELKVERLEAATEVERLESIYGYYADKSQQDAISALFADNATLEILGRGVFLGRDRVYEYMRRLGVPTTGTLFNHMQLQPVVTISPDGNSANIRARLVVMYAAAGRAAQWGEGIYENRFVKENGVWKYQALQGFQTFYTNYEQGWTRHSSEMFSPFPGYPPDMPQSIPYDPYPALFTPPFHYANPVTGRREPEGPPRK